MVQHRDYSAEAPSCRERLGAEYRRRMLERLGVREAAPSLPDDQIRLWFANKMLEAGIAPTEQLLDEAAVVVRGGERRFQDILDQVTQGIVKFIPHIAEQEARISGGPVRRDACVGAFLYPTGQYNATTVVSGDGDYLILVNAGLLELLWQAVKILGHTSRLDVSGFTYLDGVRLGPDRRTAAEALAEVVAVFLGVPVGRLGMVPRPQGPDPDRTDALFRACVTFVVAHEYAHVLAGHIDESGLRDSRLGTGMSELEVAADWLAAKLVLAPWRWGDLADDASETKRQTLVAAPLFYFALEAVVAEAEERAGRQHDISGIAPPAVRRVVLEPLFDQIFGRSYRTAVPLANLYPQWIYRMSAEVVDEISRIRSRSVL